MLLISSDSHNTVVWFLWYKTSHQDWLTGQSYACAVFNGGIAPSSACRETALFPWSVLHGGKMTSLISSVMSSSLISRKKVVLGHLLLVKWQVAVGCWWDEEGTPVFIPMSGCYWCSAGHQLANVCWGMKPSNQQLLGHWLATRAVALTPEFRLLPHHYVLFESAGEECFEGECCMLQKKGLC